MKNYLRPIAVVAALGITVGLGACSPTAPEPTEPTVEPGESFTFRYASTYGETTFEEVTQGWMLDRIEEATDGRVTFDRFYSSTIAPTPDVPAAIADGRIDVTNLLPLSYPGVFPLWGAAWIPMEGTNNKAQSSAQYELIQNEPLLQEEFAAANVHMVTMWTVPVLGMGSKEPIESVEDMQGLQIRGLGLGAAMVSALGANPVTVTVEETLGALERGTIVAMNGPGLPAWATNAWSDVAPYWSDFVSGGFGIRSLVFSTSAWESLPADLQEIITEIGKTEWPEIEGDVILPEVLKACDTLIGKGGGVVVFSDKEREIVNEKLGTVLYDIWLEQAVKAGVSSRDAAGLFERWSALAEELTDEKYSDWDDGTQACAAKSDIP